MELLVVIFIVAVLVGLLMTALASAKQKALKISCLNNLNQLGIAYTAYYGDNSGKLVANNSVPQAESPGSWISGGNARKMTNTVNIENGVLFPYTPATKTYVCPAERSVTMSTNSSMLVVPRVISYSMDVNLGNSDINYEHIWALTETQISNSKPGPSGHSVFWHEDARSIDNASFGMWNYGYPTWLNLPTSVHENGGCLSFFDGHTEYWRWKGTAVLDAGDPPTAYVNNVDVSYQNNNDLSDLFKAEATRIQPP